MRALVIACLVLLAGCAAPGPAVSFTAGPGGHFTFSAATSTVMTENDDGAAEQIRRDWLAEALRAHATCSAGYLVDTRSFAPMQDGPFGNGGDIVYTGRCL